jgi:hypothetical protein
MVAFMELEVTRRSVQCKDKNENIFAAKTLRIVLVLVVTGAMKQNIFFRQPKIPYAGGTETQECCGLKPC